MQLARRTTRARGGRRRRSPSGWSAPTASGRRRCGRSGRRRTRARAASSAERRGQVGAEARRPSVGGDPEPVHDQHGATPSRVGEFDNDSQSAENRSHVVAVHSPVALAARRSPSAAPPCRLRRRRRRRRRRSPVVAAFYPLAVRGRAGRRATTCEVANLTQPGGEPHDLELSTSSRPPTVAEADLVVYEHGFQPAVDDAVDAERRRRGRSTSADVVDLPAEHEHEHDEARPRPRRPRPALLARPAADGRRRPTRSPTQLAEVDPDHAGDVRAPTPPTLRADLERARPGVRRRAGRLRARHDRGQPRRVRLPRRATACTFERDRRPLPRRRADAGRPGPARRT